MTTSVRDEVQGWVEASWSEDLTVREWWRRMADAGLVAPHLPEPYGRGWSRADARTVTDVLVEAEVIGPPIGHLGLRLAVPTLLAHASEEQLATYLPPLLRGEEAWCQLFSEPGAGSDLPSLSASAVQDGDQWIVNGQKVWNSAADASERGMLIARTDPAAPKREGISFFVIDMQQPGVLVRPLRMMNDEADFCEVFLTDAQVESSALIGPLHHGWTVARTTLGAERASASDGGARGLVTLPSGTISGHLDRIVGEVVAAGRDQAARYRSSALRARDLVQLARDRGRTSDPAIRQGLARYHSLTEVHRLTQQRAKAAAASGRAGAEGSIAKLVLGQICNASRDLSFSILGAEAMLTGVPGPQGGDLISIGLSSPGVTIGAGTDEIQRNTIGERTLGLPREPNAEIDAR